MSGQPLPPALQHHHVNVNINVQPPPPPPPPLPPPLPPAAVVAQLQPPGQVPQVAAAPPAPQQQQQQQQQQQVQQQAGATTTAASSSSKPRNRSWDENYAELLTYKATHGGSTDVPLTYKADRILGKWVAHLREHQNQAALSQERRDALNAIGFIWNPHEQKWNEMYDRLVEYKASTGHCKVPTNWKNDRKLGKWVMRQREKRKNNLLPDHRLQKLESIGFVWKIYSEPKTRKSTIIDERWNSRYQELIEYRDTNGHSNVPKDYGPLGKWVQEQRVMHQRKLLKQERKKLLEDIGFVFSYRAQKCQQDWNQMYELLKACSTTTDDGQFKVLGMDTGLSRWVHRQKEAYKTHRLDPGREVLLNKIGFQFPERIPLKTEPEGTSASASDAASAIGAVAAGVAGAGGETMMRAPLPKLLQAASRPNTTESEKRIGLQLADGINVIAKYMDISPAELSARLALHKKAEPTAAPAPAPTPPIRESPRRKAAGAAGAAANNKKQSSPLPTNGGAIAPKSPPPPPPPPPPKDVNAFGRLLPQIVALNDLKEEDAMTDAKTLLESFVRQEKGWDPRPSEGNEYNRLLSLAAELGVLLDPTSERCQSIITTAEYQLERIIFNKRKEKGKEKDKEQPPAKQQKKKQSPPPPPTTTTTTTTTAAAAGGGSGSGQGGSDPPAAATATAAGSVVEDLEWAEHVEKDQPSAKRRKLMLGTADTTAAATSNSTKMI